MTAPKTKRAQNRQSYHQLKRVSTSLNTSSPTNGPNLSHSEAGLSNWKALSASQLLDLSETELTDLEANLSQMDKQELASKLLQATQWETPEPSLSWKTPGPPPNFHPEAHTGSIAGRGDETQTTASQGNTGSIARSADDVAEGLDELRQPLSGKYLKQQQEIEDLFSLGAFLCLSSYKLSGNQVLMKDAETIGRYGADVAESWAKLGRKYPWMYKALNRLLGATAVGLTLTSTSKMATELMENHGIQLPKIKLPGSRGSHANRIPVEAVA
jgi:hypothetical protein